MITTVNSDIPRLSQREECGEQKTVKIAESTIGTVGREISFSKHTLLKLGFIAVCLSMSGGMQLQTAVDCLSLAALAQTVGSFVLLGGLACVLKVPAVLASDLSDGYVNFDQNTPGPCDKNEFLDNFGAYPPSSSKANLYYDYDLYNASNIVFRVNFVPKEVGAEAGTSFNAPYGMQCLHGTLEYRALKNGTETDKGDKWPGSASAETPSGCISNEDFDGFSARFMTRESTDTATDELRGYIYNPDKKEECGDYYDTNPTVNIKLREWYNIKQEVYVGDPSVPNGYIYAWVDSQPVLNISNIVLGRNKIAYIEYLMMSIFPGGSDESWYSTVTSTLIDDIRFTCFKEVTNTTQPQKYLRS